MRSDSKNTTARNRARASIACLRCRERKIRCDVSTREMRCTACRNSKSHCTIRDDDDRKKRPSKDHVASLEERIALLEKAISNLSQDHSKDTPGSECSGNEQSPLNRGFTPLEDFESLDLSLIEGQSNATNCENQVLVNKNEENSDSDRIFSTIGYDLFTFEDMQTIPVESNSISETTFSFEENIFSSPTYVPKSIHTNSHDSQVMLRPNDMPKRTLDAVVVWTQIESVRRISFGFSPQINTSTSSMACVQLPEIQKSTASSFLYSPDLVNELLDIFWHWQRLAIAIVHKETFLELLRTGQRCQFYSKFLLNCILCCSARMSDVSSVRNLCWQYAKLAKNDIVSELEDPAIASIQGFCLLSEFESANARKYIGWNYAGKNLSILQYYKILTVGIACRLTFELGLQHDCTDMVLNRKMSEIESRIRRNVFFGCFVYDKLWAILLGRPDIIKLSDFDTIRPQMSDSNFNDRILAAWVELCILMAEMAQIFNSKSVIYELDDAAVRHLGNISRRLDRWKDSLPADLKWNDFHQGELHHAVFSLHMQFCCAQILIHGSSVMGMQKLCRPDIDDERFYKLLGHSIQESRTIAHDNAVRIALQLFVYQRRFAGKSVATVMVDNLYVAAATLIFCISNADARHETTEGDRRCLARVLNSFESLEAHFPVISQMRQILIKVSHFNRLKLEGMLNTHSLE